MQIDTPVQAARDQVEGEMLGAGLVGSMRPGTSGGAKELTSLAGGAATYEAKGTAQANMSEEAILDRKWQVYLEFLAHFGYGLDADYRVIDTTGKVVDTWWHDNLR